MVRTPPPPPRTVEREMLRAGRELGASWVRAGCKLRAGLSRRLTCACASPATANPILNIILLEIIAGELLNL